LVLFVDAQFAFIIPVLFLHYSGQGTVAKPCDDENNNQNICTTKLVPLLLQKGVLRTNCIDCLDRTNVAQFAYGLAALGRQLNTLGLTEAPKIELHAPVADDLMDFYERMGDTLAIQYGGSAAQNKVHLVSLADFFKISSAFQYRIIQL
jgi:phosphatidylinositol 3,5-bisphosphate 5-phosphatase